ncbi:hypothetical protein [Devosia chinhatensis]|uniref:hypothetical protein n=1 Tax=Devosia chinhatensis TaxID=429727 RepID=UPI00128C988B|nr:hypothetical protein [Devosia chinhatensis]
MTSLSIAVLTFINSSQSRNHGTPSAFPERSKEAAMNLYWTTLTSPQQKALAILCQDGPCALPAELGEQLINLGLAERAGSQIFCVSALGATVPPTTFH